MKVVILHIHILMLVVEIIAIQAIVIISKDV